MRHLLDITDLSVEELKKLIERSEEIIEHPTYYRDACRYKRLATLFFEPSTRTRLSFEAAMLSLGGSVIGFEAGSSSSTAKGETVGDTIRTVSNYSDIIVMRHPKEGAPYAAVLDTKVPIINAGDGGHNHPTQTLADILTIHRRYGRLSDLTIGLCGDLKFGRTVHSLIRCMIRYKNVKFVCVSPKELKLPEYIVDLMKKENVSFKTTTDMEEFMPELDVLYMTRVQRERFDSQKDYDRLKDCYILTPDKLKNAKKDMIVLHPLPRVNEISHEVDEDPRAAYFEQVANGKFMRMAIILRLLESAEQKERGAEIEKVVVSGHCNNPQCISFSEEHLRSYAVIKDGVKRCYYCESIIK